MYYKIQGADKDMYQACYLACYQQTMDIIYDTEVWAATAREYTNQVELVPVGPILDEINRS